VSIPLMAACRASRSLRLPPMRVAPTAATACALSDAGLRVRTQTCHPCLHRTFTAAVPSCPVPPVSRILCSVCVRLVTSVIAAARWFDGGA